MAARSSGAGVKKGERYSRPKEWIMPSGESWLSLKVAEKDRSEEHSGKATIFISVPKKIVPLAVKRNRIKRLIREVVRNHSFFKDKSKTYFFRVLGIPEKPNLSEVEREILGQTR